MGAGRKIRCLECNTVIQSQHRHDMTFCKCKNLMIDGGDAYTRFSAVAPDSWEWLE